MHSVMQEDTELAESFMDDRSPLPSSRASLREVSYDSFTTPSYEEKNLQWRSRARRSTIVGAILAGSILVAVGGSLLFGGDQKPGKAPQGGGLQPKLAGAKIHLDDSPGGGPGIKFMAIGDWGCSTNCPEIASADTSQLAVSQQMRRAAETDAGIQMVVTTGDNFYMKGVMSDHDPLWKEVFTERFGEIDLPWYAVLGNHDHLGVPEAQVSSCTDLGCPDLPANWNLPFFNYSLVRRVGPRSTVQMVLIDTWQLAGSSSNVPAGDTTGDLPAGESKRRQAEHVRWIDETLKHSKADWLIVVGHYPVYSGGEHGETPELQSLLKPLLEKHNVDMYLCGHDHTLQHLQWKGVDYVVSGGGALPGRVGLGDQHQTRFAVAQPGFSIHSVQPDQMHLTFVGAEGQHLYTYTRQRRRNSSARPLGSAAQPSRLAGGGTAKSKNTKTVRLAACMKRCKQIKNRLSYTGCAPAPGKPCMTPCEDECLTEWDALE